MSTQDENLQKWNRLVFIYQLGKIASIWTCKKTCVFNSHCHHVFRSLLSMKMAKKWPIVSVPTVTRSVLQKPKMVWGKSLRWQLGQRCRLKSVARRALAFCYKFWEAWELPLSTRWAQPPSMFGKWEVWGNDPEELNFSLPSYSQQIKVALELFYWILQICHQSLQLVWNNFCLK